MWLLIVSAVKTGKIRPSKRHSTMNLQRRLIAAQDIATRAAEVSMRHFRKTIEVNVKSDQSPVTIADQETERTMRSALEQQFPQEAIFGEEYGLSGTSSDLWIIDPIDGTRSFLIGLPLFGMLLGYVSKDAPQLGVIHMPALGEQYAGGIGLGATLNGTPISSSDCKSLHASRLFINEGDKLATKEPEVFDRLIRTGALRRMSADCYPHALVARGDADCVVDYDLQPYDYLPVSAVVEAAGGVITDWHGNPLSMKSDGRTLTAATAELHADLVNLVNA